MFGFVQWDSPLALLIEFLFAVFVFIIIMWVVRRVEKGQTAASDWSGTEPAPQLSARAEPASPEAKRAVSVGERNGPEQSQGLPPA